MRALVLLTPLLLLLAACSGGTATQGDQVVLSDLSDGSQDGDTLGDDSAAPDAGTDLESHDATDLANQEDGRDLVDQAIDEDLFPLEVGLPDLSEFADITPQISFDPAFDKEYQPIGDDKTVTTLVQTLAPRYGFRALVDDDGNLLVPTSELGQVFKQPGEEHTRYDPFALSPVPSERRSLLYFFSFGDGQLVDPESPAALTTTRTSLNKGASTGYDAYYAYLTHQADAVIQTGLQFSISRKFDFAIQLGDLAATAQHNEVDWAITLMNGGTINPDSGSRFDYIPGPVNDPRDPFHARGFGDVKWYAALGNHDVLVNGNFPPGLVEEINLPSFALTIVILDGLGLAVPGIGTSDVHRAFIPPQIDPALIIHPKSLDPHIIWNWLGRYPPCLDDDGGTKCPFQSAPIVPDPKRRFVNNCDIIRQMISVTGTLQGFTDPGNQLERCPAWYSADPSLDKGVPIRLIVLDTNSYHGGAQGYFGPPLLLSGEAKNLDGGEVIVDESRRNDPKLDQLAWLKLELKRAEDDGVAVIIASHHASGDLTRINELQQSAGDLLKLLANPPASTPEGIKPLLLALKELLERWMPNAKEGLSSEEFRKLLVASPNVIAHIAGHTHGSRIRVVCGDGTRISVTGSCTDGKGYFEIIGPSPIKYPAQGRIIEVVNNGDGTGSIFTTVIDAQGGPDSLFIRGRKLSLAEQQLAPGGLSTGLGNKSDRNTELVFKWPADLATQLDGMKDSLPSKIESETTLKAQAPGLPRLPLAPNP